MNNLTYKKSTVKFEFQTPKRTSKIYQENSEYDNFFAERR